MEFKQRQFWKKSCYHYWFNNLGLVYKFISTHILDSLDAAPPVTLATSKEANSFFSSSSCLRRSSFFFPRSSWALTFTWSVFKYIYMYLASSHRVISDTGIYQGMYQRIHESRQTSFEWILFQTLSCFLYYFARSSLHRKIYRLLDP